MAEKDREIKQLKDKLITNIEFNDETINASTLLNPNEFNECSFNMSGLQMTD